MLNCTFIWAFAETSHIFYLCPTKLFPKEIFTFVMIRVLAVMGIRGASEADWNIEKISQDLYKVRDTS